MITQEWRTYFDDIFVLNLRKRTDRLQRITEMIAQYGFDYTVYEAIPYKESLPKNKWCLGLVQTMQKLFTECLNAGYERIIILEDDAKIVVSPETFHGTMNKCVEDLRNINWGLFYLGLQACLPFKGYMTKNLLQVNWGQSTHAVAYSKHAMEYLSERFIDEPIDNFIVREYQPRYNSYCSCPLLVTQEAGFSDILGEHVNWNMYITHSYEQNLRLIKK